MKKCIAIAAFAAIFLSALFLFMRNYPSDRLFSIMFILAGGVMAWCVWGADAAEAGETTAEYTETTTTAADTEAEAEVDAVPDEQ